MFAVNSYILEHSLWYVVQGFIAFCTLDLLIMWIVQIVRKKGEKNK